MKFKILKTSETGKKLSKINNLITKANDAIIELSTKYRFKEWRCSSGAAYGGIHSVFFIDGEEVQKYWRKVEGGGYYPNLRYKKGKEIAKELAELPRVFRVDLNRCVGYNNHWNKIGFNPTKQNIF